MRLLVSSVLRVVVRSWKLRPHGISLAGPLEGGHNILNKRLQLENHRIFKYFSPMNGGTRCLSDSLGGAQSLTLPSKISEAKTKPPLLKRGGFWQFIDLL